MFEKLPQFLTFADGSYAWRATGVRLGKLATKSGMFSKVVVLNAKNLSESKRGHLYHAGARGYGFWRWKPEIIWEQLKSLPQDCPGLWYVDAGCTIFDNEIARARLDEYAQIAREFGWGLAFHLDSRFSDAKYTKELVAQTFGLTEEMLKSGQVQATAIFFANNTEGRALSQAWFEASNRGELFDDTDVRPSAVCADNDFVEHRHDQSVLSALIKSRALSTLPDELNVERATLLTLDPVTVPIVATRHRSLFPTLSMNPLMRFIRLLERTIP